MHKAAYLLPLAGTLLFGWATVELVRAAWEASSSRAWPTAAGTVQHSQWHRYSGRGCHFTLDLRYAYVVDGASYVGNNYRFGGECGDGVIRIAEAHPVGTPLAVRYDPERPARSVVAVGDLAGNTVAGLVVAPTMLLLSLYLFWHLKKRA